MSSGTAHFQWASDDTCVVEYGKEISEPVGWTCSYVSGHHIDIRNSTPLLKIEISQPVGWTCFMVRKSVGGGTAHY